MWMLVACGGPVGEVAAPANAPAPALADPVSVRALWDGDAQCVAEARAAGATLATAGAVVFVVPAAPWAERFAGEAVAGIEAARRYLASHGLEAAARVEIYACDRKIISHAPGAGFVFLSRAWVQEQRAPWLHEAMHVLLRGPGPSWLADFDEAVAERDMPLWLVEGLTEYLAQAVSERARVANLGPFSVALAELDATCAREAQAGLRSVLEHVGRAGRPADWFGPTRYEKAKVFYPCATSFVAWLAQHHGLAPLLTAQREVPRELVRWEELTGAKLEVERGRWLERLGLAVP